ncbi:NACHT domain-containing protein [Streptomyces sp. Amel2xB2]|uniref:NACHT domain-containing protein n=1 Tax=Streptomyces sp. Amel2xB2 TaxID=1305829 RepID=UPI000DBA0749|nr:NACHT domain-containing protein [Streptomyces sp. Amel2xB2]RAJ59829.1 NACHT domain-containing protein [Streptomyces sp. Amel2xB2]
MEPISIGARVSSAVAGPLVRRLFRQPGPGAGLVGSPVRLDALVAWREKSTLGEAEVRRVAEQLVREALRNEPGEPPVAADEETAVADALAGTLHSLGDIGMDEAQAVRLRPDGLALVLRRAADETARAAVRHLSADGEALYDSLLELACLHILHFFTRRETFPAATAVETVRMLDELVQRVDQALTRLTDQSAEDAAFEKRYLARLAEKHGRLRIFGVDFSDPGRAQWPLGEAYLSLETSQTGGAYAGTRRRVEEALALHPRVMLRGEAGSGKTTLVQWLAVSAATRRLSGTCLEHLAGHVPFVLPVRTLTRTPDAKLPGPGSFLSSVGQLIHEEEPDGWTLRVLRSGRGMLLIDGVDEAPEADRERVRAWVAELLGLYPESYCLVTSRPSALETGWLQESAFSEVMLLDLSRHDAERFVHRWHAAVATTVPARERAAVAELRDSLVNTLQTKPDLRQLATSPLLCALICALHRDRHRELPRNRMALYEAALTMLLLRRDEEREVQPPEGINPSAPAEMRMLQRIAFWLLQNGRAEVHRGSAERIVERALPAMPQVAESAQAPEVLRFLLLRTGLLLQPTENTLSFVHRVFQDFLAARQIVEDELFGLLVDNAHKDQWEDVVRMTLGHCRERECAEVLDGLLEKGEAARRASLGLRWRRLHLLAVSGLEYVTTLGVGMREKTQTYGRALWPPPEDDERAVRLLADVGPVVLDIVPEAAEVRGEREAEAAVQIAGRLGGNRALHLLRQYRDHAARGVRQRLADAWGNFDTVRYAGDVLSHVSLDGVRLHLGDMRELAALEQLGTVCEVVAGSGLAAQCARGELAERLAGQFAARRGPEYLRIEDCAELESLVPLQRLPLRQLELLGVPEDLDLAPVLRMPRLLRLTVQGRLPEPLLSGAGETRRPEEGNTGSTGTPSLRELRVDGLRAEPEGLAGVGQLRGLERVMVPRPTTGADALARLAELPALRSLVLHVTDTSELARAPRLPQVRQLALRTVVGEAGLGPLPEVFPGAENVVLALSARAGSRSVDLTPLHRWSTCVRYVAVESPHRVTGRRPFADRLHIRPERAGGPTFADMVGSYFDWSATPLVPEEDGGESGAPDTGGPHGPPAPPAP